MASFGRYTGGGSAYDRAIYLELFNGKKVFRRDLKSARSLVKNSRLNICVLGHPHSFIKAIREERGAYEDGLMQRFLSCCPKPHFFSSFEINEARSTRREFSMTVLLYIARLLHERFVLIEKTNEKARKKIEYTFEEESQTLFNEVYTEYRRVSEQMIRS
jgi:hypothetical protein